MNDWLLNPVYFFELVENLHAITIYLPRLFIKILDKEECYCRKATQHAEHLEHTKKQLFQDF